MHQNARLLLIYLVWFVGENEAENVDKTSTLEPKAFPSNRSQEYRAVTDFRNQMLHGISMFPIIRQCSILASILGQSGEKILPIAGDLIYEPHQHLPCLRGVSNSGSLVNTSALRRATDVHVSKVFNRLPLAYKCLVLSHVARAIHGKGSGSFKETEHFLHETMATLTRELPLLDLTGKCASEKSRPITKAYVRLGVRLRKLMPFNVWLKRFKNKLPALYLRHASKSGKISEIVSNWKRHENGDSVAVIPRDKFVVRIKDAPIRDDNVVIMTFTFLSRQNSGDYTTVDGEDVVASLNTLRRSQLNNLLQAEIIGSSAFAEDNSERRHPHRNRKLSDAEIARLFAFFPKYLRRFFKSLPSSDRCYILRQTSISLGQEALLVEKSYHSLGSLRKKHFCSRATKQDPKEEARISKPRVASIWDKVDELCRAVVQPAGAMPTVVPNTTALLEDARVVRETRPFNTMELVMFVLLGFLCVLIMVFVANCVLFTFKTKQLNSKCDEVLRQEIEKCKTPESNEVTMKISENPLHKLADDHGGYSILVVAPLPPCGENDSQKNIVIDWKSGLHHSTRIWSETKERGATLCEVLSLADDRAGKPKVENSELN